MGYKRAGFRVIGNCEIDPKIAKVYERNLHPQYSYVMDLREFNTLGELPDELYNLDVLDGSPPCSTFSVAGSREDAWGVEKRFAEGQKKQRLDDLFFVYLDTVKKLQPKVFVAENVVGLLRGNAKGYVNEIVRKSKEIGYDVQLFKLDASFMGVPQKRERVFFVANRLRLGKIRLAFNESIVTFGSVRSEQGGAPLSKRMQGLFDKANSTDDGLGDITRRLEGRETSFNYRFAFDNKPCKTITAANMLIRRCDGTRLTVEDVTNASSFPQDYDYLNVKPSFITGMSIPPSMMANIAHEIRTQWLEA